MAKEEKVMMAKRRKSDDGEKGGKSDCYFREAGGKSTPKSRLNQSGKDCIGCSYCCLGLFLALRHNCI